MGLASTRLVGTRPTHVQWSEDLQNIVLVVPDDLLLLFIVSPLSDFMCHFCRFLAAAPLSTHRRICGSQRFIPWQKA